MYAYDHDPETGGLLLRAEPLPFSKEPRPVYHEELTLMGFDKLCQYPLTDDAPIMWAEANNYWYRGRKVARTIGGSLYHAPQLELLDDSLRGATLLHVDLQAMVDKNHLLVEGLANEAMRFVYNSTRRYATRVDLFYVAYSGGKDSQVLLDIVQRALPASQYKVVFGDTGMEFPDTYEAVDATEDDCRQRGVEFLRCRSHLNPAESWRLFGPPATVLRWCCSVHKTAPQILALRQLTGKPDFRGFAFIGVRAAESVARSAYKPISQGMKHKGQWNAYPLLEWNSAELFAYIFHRGLTLNKAYLKGNHRVGCLLCPRAAVKSEYVTRQCYETEKEQLIDSIRYAYRNRFQTKEQLDRFVAKAGWKGRKTGDDLSIPNNYKDYLENRRFFIKVSEARTDWKEWIKVLGVLIGGPNDYRLIVKDKEFVFRFEGTCDNYTISFDAEYIRTAVLVVKNFKYIFHKAAVCVSCRECEANCPNAYLHFDGSKVVIDTQCQHCGQCLAISNGCILYDCTKKTKQTMTAVSKSLNCYSNHAPQLTWFTELFQRKADFFESNSLGSKMFHYFKTFLRHAGILSPKSSALTDFGTLILSRPMDDEVSWALMLANLAYTPQIGWAVEHVAFDSAMDDQTARDQLIADGAKDTIVNDVLYCYRRFSKLPLSKVGFPVVDKVSTTQYSLTRSPWPAPDPRVLLYSLFLYAEHAAIRSFPLSSLYDTSLQSAGVSPVRIFGTNNEAFRAALRGLSASHPDFLHAGFTHDLDDIALADDKTHTDVLSLIL